MSEKRVAELFQIRNRFLRSAQLERDFQDPSALSGYVVTEFARSCLGRLATGLRPRSGNRAWRMTGDYGCGKSSFALLLAHWFAGNDQNFPAALRKAVDPRQFGVQRPQFFPVLVTCTRQSLGTSILTSLQAALTQIQSRGPASKLALEVRGALASSRVPQDDEVFRLICETNSRLIAHSKAKGLLLILDELGKFLEFAAMHPEQQDVFLLQRLAEEASRSGDQPLFVVSLLHQGFSAYVDHLDQSAQREWEKVAGRFEEIVFNQPVAQTAQIISAAIDVRTDQIPRLHVGHIRRAMEEALALGWMGAAPDRTLSDAAMSLYPLHPTVLPVLIRTFRRFGQNERSLFSFLLSNEPFGFQAFADRKVRSCGLYRLHHFYDYVRTNFGHRLAAQSYRSHWNLIDSLIESFVEADELQLNILKTVGILNLLNDGDLIATEESVLCALDGSDPVERKHVRAALNVLRTQKRMLYDRGRARGLCLWPHTSVDLEKAYEDACRAIEAPKHVAGIIKDTIEARPIVARRHYIETGNLRHWDVRYCSVASLPAPTEAALSTSDGVIVFPLCETVAEHELALKYAKTRELEARSTWLVAVPQPLNSLAGLVQEVQRWEWVAANTPELNADKYAREEVSRQRAAAQLQLEKRIRDYVDWQHLGGQTMLAWFRAGRQLNITNGRPLLEELSRIFDETYALAPRIHNELVNRRTLSSAAAAARMRLIGRMFSAPRSQSLGMDPHKKPPEMSMYLSVLKRTGMHSRHDDSWRIGEPPAEVDPCNVLPVLRRIGEIVRDNADARVNVATLCEELRMPPYGVRDGVLPLFLAVFAIANDRDVAIYKDGSFLREFNSEQMLLLTKAPERFEIQYCKIEGVRAELFERLLAVLEISRPGERDPELLDLVKSLCQFVAQLPAYVRNTQKLSSAALAVRHVILEAREPAKLVFYDLPVACGFAPIQAGTEASTPIKSFVTALKLALDEMRVVFAELQDRLRNRLQESFDLPGAFRELRGSLSHRARQVCLTVTEPRLKSFCLRLMDDGLPEADWLESIGSHVGLKPPSRWHDPDEDLFASELAQLAARFRRVEVIVFNGHRGDANAEAVRLAVTLADGREHEQVIHVPAEDAVLLDDLQARFATLLAQNERLGLAAVSRAIWVRLQATGKATHE